MFTLIKIVLIHDGWDEQFLFIAKRAIANKEQTRNEYTEKMKWQLYS